MVSDMIQKYRGDGTTTRQMLSADTKAVYIVAGMRLQYHRELAIHLNRADLQIVSESWLKRRAFEGMNLSEIILDHSYIPDYFTYCIYQEALARVRN